MNNTAKGILLFVAGAAVGSVVTWRLAKNKCERIIQAEVDAFRADYTKKKKALEAKEKPNVSEQESAPAETVEESEIIEEPSKEEVEEYEDILMRQNYIDYSEARKSKQEEAPKDKPYVISPSEFGLEEEYTQITLNYFADFVLADEDDYPINDVDGLVGKESLLHFGEYEDDAVHVRNDRLRCYVEILLDERKYSDVYRQGPHGEED